MSAFGLDCGSGKEGVRFKPRLRVSRWSDHPRARVTSLTTHNTHLKDPVYLDLVCDLVLVHGENLLHSYHGDCDRETSLTAAIDAFIDVGK